MQSYSLSRICTNCSRAFTGKAGRIVNGQPCCPPCGNILRPPVSCTSCGRLTTRPTRSQAHAGLICESCLRQDSHATCQVCRRHRPIAGRDDVGRPLCRACHADPPVTHACPDCHRQASGGGKARCHDCALTARVTKTASKEAETIPSQWARSLFEAFISWINNGHRRGDLAARTHIYADFFRTLDTKLDGPASIDQRALLEIFGSDGLRRQHLATGFIVETLALVWTPTITEDITERRRMAIAAASTATQPWANDFDAYSRFLDASEIRTVTKRQYLTAASHLLKSAKVDGVAMLSQLHLRRHLRRKPGQAASLTRFVSWAADKNGQAFALPPRRISKPRAAERRLIQQAAALIRKLENTGTPRRRRAILAATISTLYNIPLSKVLALRTEDLQILPDHIRIWNQNDKVILSGQIASALVDVLPVGGLHVFSGLTGIKGLSSDVVRYHLRDIAPPRKRTTRSRPPRPDAA